MAVLHEQRAQTVGDDQRKLDHLDGGQIAFPPQVGTHLRAQSCQSVVGVHDRVHGRVEQRKQGVVATGSKLETNPDGDGNNTVVDDVQEGHLTVLFAQNEKDRVQEFDKLGQEEHVADLNHANGFVIKTVKMVVVVVFLRMVGKRERERKRKGLKYKLMPICASIKSKLGGQNLPINLIR